MSVSNRLSILLVLAALAASSLACALGGAAAADPTSPPEAATTAPTDAPAETSAPTAAPTDADAEPDAAAAAVTFGETVEMPLAGYQFGLVSGYTVDAIDGDEGEAVVSHEAERVLIALRALPPSTQSAQQVIDDFVVELTTNEFTPYVLALGEPYSTTANGHDALAVDFTGTLLDFLIAGRITVVDLGDGQRVRVFGYADVSEDGMLWDAKGAPYMSATLETLDSLTP